MTKPIKILLPTDFSKNAKHAHLFALDFAEKLNASIILLHVFEAPILSTDNMAINKNDDRTLIARDMRQVATDELVSLVGASSKKHGVHQSMITCEGLIIEEILGTIKGEEIDLVIMGTKGKTSDSSVYMGSVTSGLLTEANCPILSIPDNANLKHELTNIVYATDLQDDETNVINFFTLFAELLNVSVSILHITEAGEEENKQLNNLKEAIGRVENSKISYAALCNPDIAAGINEFVQTQKASMLAMTTHDIKFLDTIFHESLSKKMLLQSHIPFLSFNRKKDYTQYFM